MKQEKKKPTEKSCTKRPHTQQLTLHRTEPQLIDNRRSKICQSIKCRSQHKQNKEHDDDMNGSQGAEDFAEGESIRGSVGCYCWSVEFEAGLDEFFFVLN